MKPSNTLFALIIGILSLFTISNANASGCSSNPEKKGEIECYSEEKKCIDTIEKNLVYKAEA